MKKWGKEDISETQAKYSLILQINCSTNEEDKKGHMLLHENGHVLLTWQPHGWGHPKAFQRGEHLYWHHELTFVCIAFYSLEATNICFATQYVTNSVYFPLTCLFALMCKTVCDRHLETPFHTARHHRVENSSRRWLTPSSRLGKCM